MNASEFVDLFEELGFTEVRRGVSLKHAVDLPTLYFNWDRNVEPYFTAYRSDIAFYPSGFWDEISPRQIKDEHPNLMTLLPKEGAEKAAFQDLISKSVARQQASEANRPNLDQKVMATGHSDSLAPSAGAANLVVYHSERKMGRPYWGTGEEFDFFSRKSESQLRAAIGQKVWVFSSEGTTNLSFFLAGWYVPSEMDQEEDAWRLVGKGHHLRPYLDVTSSQWFRELFDEQNNFSYGNFSRIRSGTVISELNMLSAQLSLGDGPSNGWPAANLVEIRRFMGDDAALEIEIIRQPDLSETTKIALVEARRGQGLFKSRVQQLEPKCRVTGLADIKHLRASHLKPWRDSTNDERLAGENGLLLAPHVDHLVDQGYISFSNVGDVLTSSPHVDRVLEVWGISLPRNVGPFRIGQRPFLAYHRDVVFEGACKIRG